MKNPIRMILCAGLLLSACKESGNGPDAVDVGEFNANPKVGEKRLLLLEFKSQGGTYGFDTFYLSLIEIEKDTVFQGKNGKIIKSITSELFPESTSVQEDKQLLVREGDSVVTYSFNHGRYSRYLFGLLKSAAYDTALFSDRVINLVYPPGPAAKWKIRSPEDTIGLALDKEWVGNDTLAFEGRRFRCDVFVLHSFVPVKSWIASIGLLKAEIDYGKSYYTDSAGTVLDSAQDSERYELLNLNPTENEIAAAMKKYRAMYKMHLPPASTDP